MFAHGYFELPGRPAPLPAVILVAHAVEALRDPQARDAATRHKLHVDVSEEQAAEMGYVSHIAAALNGEGQGHNDQNRNEIFGLERNGERNHQDFVLTEYDSERDQDSEYSTRRAYRRYRGIAQDVSVGEHGGGQCRADNA